MTISLDVEIRWPLFCLDETKKKKRIIAYVFILCFFTHQLGTNPADTLSFQYSSTWQAGKNIHHGWGLSACWNPSRERKYNFHLAKLRADFPYTNWDRIFNLKNWGFWSNNLCWTNTSLKRKTGRLNLKKKSRPKSFENWSKIFRIELSKAGRVII